MTHGDASDRPVSPGRSLTRRALLAGAATAATEPPAAAPPAAPSARGPKVFLGYDQAELDRAWDQRVWAPNMEL
jgi:hypothetical protein